MYKLIVVDDEEEIRNAVVNLVDFKSLGFDLVGEASNGMEGLELVEALEPDLIITDIKMPFMNGIEFARSVREIHPNTFIAFLTGYDDFEYAKEAIKHNVVSYILKPVNATEFNEEMTVIKSKMDRRMQEIQNPPNLTLQTELTKLQYVTTLFPLLYKNQNLECLLKIKDMLANCGILLNDKSKISVACIDFGKDIEIKQKINFLEQVANKYLQSFVLQVDKVGVVIFFGTEKDLNKFVKISAMEIIEVAKKALNADLEVGVSAVYDFAKLHKGFSDAMTALEYAKSLENNMIFIYDIERGNINIFDRFLEITDEINEKLKHSDDQEFRKYLNELIETIIKENLDIEKFTTYCASQINQTLMSLTENLNKEIESKLYSLAEIKDANYFVREFALRIMDIKKYFNEIKMGSIEKLCDDAIKIIDKNYNDYDLSLNSLARTLNCSSPYLSSIIKKYSGESFVNILTKKRMTEAKKLIENTDLKIVEIAEKCGYFDQHYFSYCYKKYFGISPLKSRR